MSRLLSPAQRHIPFAPLPSPSITHISRHSRDQWTLTFRDPIVVVVVVAWGRSDALVCSHRSLTLVHAENFLAPSPAGHSTPISPPHCTPSSPAASNRHHLRFLTIGRRFLRSALQCPHVHRNNSAFVFKQNKCTKH